MIEPGEILRRQDQWRRAYLATPHGQPCISTPRLTASAKRGLSEPGRLADAEPGPSTG